jgi:hypothetical protein
MLCFLCGKKIGLLRSLVDQQYCSKQHRLEARLASARALRDEEEVEPWSVAKKSKKNPGGKPGASAGQTASIFAFLTVAGLVVIGLVLPSSGGGGSGPAFPSLSADSPVKRGWFARAGDAISNVVQSAAPVTLRHDFGSGLSDWSIMSLGTHTKVDDPHGYLASASPNDVLPGSLRLWKKSTSLSNYQMEFQAQIERKSLSWAYRATNEKNYYATKLVMTHAGPQPNAGLVRYLMLNGHEWDRVQMPLPLTLERGTSYKVRVSVQDDRFITYVNGQVVSSWRDQRLPRGGVGFFADDDDAQKVAWVSLSERDSFLGRLLSHFSLIVMPGAPASGLDE